MARRKRTRGSITAAGRRVDLSGRAVKRRREAWHEDAWAAFDDVPEVKELMLWRADQIAKLNLFAAIRIGNDDRQEPVPLDSELAVEAGVTPAIAAMVQAELAAFSADLGGQSEILKRIDVNCEVAGEVWCVGFDALTPEPVDLAPPPRSEWIVASGDEIDVIDGKRYYADRKEKFKNLGRAELSDDEKPREIRNGIDDLFRIWQPHARQYDLPDCALRGCLTESELVEALTNQMLAEARSRASAGFMTIPNELAIQMAGGKTIDGKLVEGAEPDEADPFMKAVMSTLMDPAADPTHPSAVAPSLIRGPADFLKPDVLRWFTSPRPLDATIDSRLDGRIRRLARGLSAPPEKVLGFDATTFANADQVDDDTWSDYLQPRAEFIVTALTVSYLLVRPKIQALSPEIRDRLVIWYDASDVISQPDTSGVNADEAYDRGEISGEAYRQARGFDESAKPEPDERMRRFAFARSVITPDMVAQILKDYALEGGVDLTDWAVPAASTATAGVPGGAGSQAALLSAFIQATAGRQVIPTRAVTASSTFAYSTGPGRDLVGLDRDLRTRLLVAANGAMERAVEKAAARLRSKVQGQAERYRNVANADLARTMGRPAVTAAIGEDDVWADAWVGLAASWSAWTDAARAEAVLILAGLAGLSEAATAALEARLIAGAFDAWGWLSQTLSGIADDRLFGNGVVVPSLGEFDAALTVPAGAIRQAVARAGGTAGLDTTQGGIWVTLTADGKDAGGYAFGTFARDALRDGGAGVEGYEWDYGPGFRHPFEPHRRLSGKTFRNFDDPVLANNLGWPGFAFFIPGDHGGCQCDAIPVIIPAAELAEAS